MNPPVEPSRTVTLLLLVAILATGAVLRLQAVPSKFGPQECAGGDVYRYYVSVATALQDGRGWITDYEWNFIPPPGQAAFILVGRALIPGADFQTLRYLQAILGVLALLPAWWVGYRMGGRWAGLAAAGLLAIDPHVVETVSILLAENNYYFLLMLFLALLLEAVRRRSVAWSAAAGCGLALASLTKPFPMFLALLLPLYLALRYRDRRALYQGAAIVLGFAVLVSPWLVRNYLRYERFYLISTNAGTLMAQSNFAVLDPADPEQIYWEQIYREDAWKSPAIEREFQGRVDRYGRPEWNEKDRAYMKHALGYIAERPLHFARNYTIKLYNTLRYPLVEPGGRPRPVHFFRVMSAILGLAGLAAFALIERREPQWIMVPVFAYFLGFTALLHIVRSGRINLPMKVVLGLFAAWLLGRAAGLLARRWPRIATWGPRG
jgi:4-amino-4-deoxy-L-arabinose transferase-like glycosyltransferase